MAGGVLLWTFLDTALGILESCLGWWLFSQYAGGSRHLNDPRSAMQFVLLVVGVAAGFGAFLRAIMVLLLNLPGAETPGLLLALFWLARALGILVLVPPLLVTVTPWLVRTGWIASSPAPTEEPDSDSTTSRIVPPTSPRPATSANADTIPHPLPGRFSSRNLGREPLSATRQPAPRLGDWVEIIGLAIGASLLCLILSRLHGRRELLGWQLWGVQILVIVWASLRQGLRGGTVTASAAAILPLLTLSFRPTAEDPLFQPLLQAHLMAQCAAALLIASASSWVRLHENSYRQVVAHVPVVIYSARLRKWLPPGVSLRASATMEGEIGADLAEVTLVSAASAGLLGRPAEQLLGDFRRWLTCIHPEDHIVVLAALEQLTLQEMPVTCEYRLAHSTESSDMRWAAMRGEAVAGGPGGLREAVGLLRTPVRWLRDTLAPHRDSEGRLIGWEGVVTDITEQRHLADDLRRTTSMFHALVANLPTGVFFIQGPNGNPLIVNSRARQLLGTREDAAAGLEFLPTVYRLYRPDGTLYPAHELPVYLALKQGRTTMRDDIVVHRPDGRRIPLVTWAAPVHLSQREAPDCAVWVLEDLTALHQAEAARKDSEGRLRAVIETMAEGLLVLDPKGLIASANGAAAALFSMSTEDLRGKALFDLGWHYLREDGTMLSPGEHPGEMALRTGRPVRHVMLGLKPLKGSDPPLSASTFKLLGRWVLINAMPLGSGHPAGVVTTMSDISAYVHAREAIRISEERYRGLVETLPLILIQCDRYQRIVYANPALKTVTGYDLADVSEPSAWASVLHPEDLNLAQQLAQGALTGTPQRGELRYRAKEGTEKVCYALIQPRYQDGVIIGTTTLLVDVTRERKLEKELDRARRLELVGRLSSGVAHDFNNLLGVVLNLTDLAGEHLPRDHPARADLKRISEAGEQAANLAAQLLAFSRQRPAPARRLDLNAIVRRTLSLLRASLPGEIQLHELLSAEPTMIRADETQIQQVLMNLCLNARDAMPQGGQLRVKTWASLLNEDPHPSESRRWVYLVVEDTGSGMPPEMQKQIFEAFFSTKEGGTGLGLAVVQQVVESYDGQIEVQSQLGQGTRFVIRWPEA